MPKGVTIANGIIASIVVLLLPVAEAFGIGDFFWVLFSVGVVFLLFSYIPMFPAFLKLRRIDPNRNRLFRVPGSRAVLSVLAWLPVVILVLAAFITIVPLDGSESELAKLPMLITVIAFIILGEVVRHRRGQKTSPGTTLAWARAANHRPVPYLEPKLRKSDPRERSTGREISEK